MEKICMKQQGDTVIIGEFPQLVVDLKTQKNYIKTKNRTIPYYREVAFSEDLLAGKRENVLTTAVNYYYRQACEVAAGIEAAEAYREKANRTVREIKSNKEN